IAFLGLLLLLANGLALTAQDLRRDSGLSRTDALPSVFDKDVPDSVQDLQAIQKQVRKILDRVIPCTVGLMIGNAQGSGVIISKDGYVLTAGHVSGSPGQDVDIVLHDGRKLKGRTLGANRDIDSGMVKITSPGTWPYVDMGKSSEIKRGQWCLAIGHPGGFQAGRSPVVRLGRVLEHNDLLLRTDCALVGGDSGGPLFDMNGKVIGIHSRIGNTLQANIHVPVDTYKETWDRLAQGEIWGGKSFGQPTEAYMGIRADPDAKGIKIATVADDSPAAKSGLRANDIITMVDGKKVDSMDDLIKHLRTKKPGQIIAVNVQRGAEAIFLKLTLGKRPL